MKVDFTKRPGQRRTKPVKNNLIEPLVSIVTPYFNSQKNFMETFYSVINQSMEEFEWIIVNDGSTDQTETAFLDEIAEKDKRIRVIHQDNGGQSKAKNHAIRESRTDIIVFLDADDLIEPFYIEYLYKALQEYPDAGWSYMDLVGFGDVEYIWCKKFSAGRMTFNNILVNSAAFRKDVLKEAGYFAEIEKHYDEDWALYLKLLANKVHPVHIPVIGFWYRKSAAGMQQTVRKNEKLRKASDSYIQTLAKDVPVRLKEEMYQGELPEEAVKSEYAKIDGIVAGICSFQWGCSVLKRFVN